MRRIALLIVIMLIAILPVSAQVGPRVPPANDAAASAAPLVLPNTVTLAAMEEATNEAGEPLHKCVSGGPNAGLGSVWYWINVPAGTLTVDTATTALDTVISLYPKPAGVPDLASLHAIKCAVNGTGGSAQAKLKKAVGAGAYLVQISRLNDPGAATDLHAAFTFTPDAKTKGDTPAKFVSMKFNVPTKVKNAQYAFASDGFVPSCNTAATVSSVWFYVEYPFEGEVTLSAEGTSLMTANGVSDHVTLTSHYYNFDGPPSGQFGCHDNLANVPLNHTIYGAGEKVWYRLATDSPTNLSGKSTYVLNMRYTSAVELFSDGEFEYPAQYSLWTVKKATNGDGFTTAPAEKISDNQSFKFIGSAHEATRISQSKYPQPTAVFAQESDFSFAYKPLNGATQKVTWELLFYADNNPTVKLTGTVTASTSGVFTKTIQIPYRTINQYTLTFKNKNKSGSIVIDDAHLIMAAPEPARGVLPLPPPPR